ncbi:tetratricopeptide repeat protein [bacterium]|nr:tetratricopeptide repeat protein [bacterium]
MVKEKKRRVALLIAMISLLFGVLSSCVYFNTFYNARRIYSDVEEKRKRSKTSIRIEEYQPVVVKCSTILQNHPGSRWADDAAFLLGKALFRQGEYIDAAKKFEEIIDNWPKKKYAPLSLFWLGKVYFETEEYKKALTYTTRFLKQYPKHKMTFRMMLLAGETNLKLDQRKEALAFYSRVIQEADDDRVIGEAKLKCADLHFSFEQWEKAAGFYESILHKGISWKKRYNTSLPLGKCYTKLGRCSDALGLYDNLLEKVNELIEKPPILLGKAAGYVCMDSLDQAMQFYEEVIGKFPSSLFSAEAAYYLGTLYHERTDSLEKAKEYFAKVGKEAPESEYATEALKKSNSIARLLELENVKDGEETENQKAKRRFYSAELQLSQFGNTEEALENYIAVLDSFPEVDVSSRAAYAIGWIYQKKLNQKDKALTAFTEVAKRFPRSVQATGAIEQIGYFGNQELKESLQSYVDSMRALPPDTSAADWGLELPEVSGSGNISDSLSAESDSMRTLQPDTTAAPSVTPVKKRFINRRLK